MAEHWITTNINNRVMKRLYILILLLLAASCVKSPEYPPVCGVGFPDGDVSCGYQEGSLSAKVLSSGEFVATIEESAHWLRFADKPSSRKITANGDVYLRFVYDINRSVPRQAKVTLLCGNNQAVMTVSQDGLLSDGFELKVARCLLHTKVECRMFWYIPRSRT